MPGNRQIARISHRITLRSKDDYPDLKRNKPRQTTILLDDIDIVTHDIGERSNNLFELLQMKICSVPSRFSMQLDGGALLTQTKILYNGRLTSERQRRTLRIPIEIYQSFSDHCAQILDAASNATWINPVTTQEIERDDPTSDEESEDDLITITTKTWRCLEEDHKMLVWYTDLEYESESIVYLQMGDKCIVVNKKRNLDILTFWCDIEQVRHSTLEKLDYNDLTVEKVLAYIAKAVESVK